MAREIKFRAWFEVHKKMVEHENLGLYYAGGEDGFHTAFDSMSFSEDMDSEATFNFKLMQYTGLKDRNGKDIWEGDVASGEHATYAIWWDERMAQFKAKVVKTKSVLIRNNSFPLWQYVEEDGKCRIEVIGNIYNNPELLEANHG